MRFLPVALRIFMLLLAALSIQVSTDSDVCEDKTTGSEGPVALPIADTNAHGVLLEKNRRPSAELYVNCESGKITKCVFAAKTVDLVTLGKSYGYWESFDMTMNFGAKQTKPHCCFTFYEKTCVDLKCYATLKALKFATE